MPSSENRAPGETQRFADRAGGPTLYEGTGYQTGVSLVEFLGLLARQQQAPALVLRLRCEARQLVAGGQFGYDLGVLTPDQDRQIEMKSSPVKDEVVELVARLASVVGTPGRTLQLIHGKATKWTEALDLLVANGGEAVDDDDLDRIVAASGDTDRRTLLDLLAGHDAGAKALLLHLQPPEFMPPASVRNLVERHAHALACEQADELVRRLTQTLDTAFRSRATLVVADVLGELVDAGLIFPVTVLTPQADPALTQAVGVLEACRVPLPEPVLAGALGVPPGGARALLADLIEARVVVEDAAGLWRVRTSVPLPRSLAGSAVREVLASLVDDPPVTHLERVAQVPNVLALADACLTADPALVSRAFYPYDKASKATGDLSTVYLLARTAVEALARVDGDGAEHQEKVLWLRGHARICGTSWTLQRVGQEAEALVEMDAARADSRPFNAVDNLAFVDKCQGRLHRLLGEQHEANGDHATAVEDYERSRAALDSAHQQFTALLGDPRFATRYEEEPGECLALRARTELSAGQLEEAARFAARAHAELDGLGPRCKPWADVCLVDAEVALERARDNMPADQALALLSAEAEQLDQVLAEFIDDADADDAVDFGANEIVARTLQVSGQLAVDTGQPERAATLFERAADHYRRVDQQVAEYRCRAWALELRGELPTELLLALRAVDANAGCVVEAARLHLADPRSDMPERHWAGLVTAGAVAAAAREHRWTDRAAG